MPSQATQQLIDQAYADLQQVSDADASARQADQTVSQNQAAALAAHQAALGAHQKQTASSAAAISALAAELGYTLPSTSTSTSSTGGGGGGNTGGQAPAPTATFRQSGPRQDFSFGGAGAVLLKWLPTIEEIIKDLKAVSGR